MGAVTDQVPFVLGAVNLSSGGCLSNVRVHEPGQIVGCLFA